MKILSAKDISTMVEGKLLANPEITINQVSTDTRTLRKGALFIAIKGDRFDGHDYLEQAVVNGAALVMVQDDTKISRDIPAILVNDTLEALVRLAAAYRKLFDIPMVAVTGSVGKTSTKEMIATILSARYNVHKSQEISTMKSGFPFSAGIG